METTIEKYHEGHQITASSKHGVEASALRSESHANWEVFAPGSTNPEMLQGSSGWAVCDVLYHLSTLIREALTADLAALTAIHC